MTMSKENIIKQNSSSKPNKTHLIVGCGVLAAAATALQYLEIPSPVNFIALDFSDLPALLGAFAYGPVAGILIEFIKNVIHLAVSRSGYVGELSNFILGAVFTLTAGLIYQKHKTKKSAILGGVIGGKLSVKPLCCLSVLLQLYAERGGARRLSGTFQG